MPDRMKRTVALGVMALWVLLSGICFSEEFGYFQDTPESTDQTVEQALSIPADRVAYSPDELPGASKFTGIINTTLIVSLQTAWSVAPKPLISQHPGSPGHTKLFQLLSTYRI